MKCKQCRFCKIETIKAAKVESGDGFTTIIYADKNGEPFSFYECHFNPPDAKSKWPGVSPDNFCGKFEAKTTEAKPTIEQIAGRDYTK